MSKRNNFIIVFDLETDSLEVEKGIGNINEIGAVAIDLRNLTIDKDNHFFTIVKPNDIDEPDYYEKYKKTIDMHIQWTGKPLNQLLDYWRSGVPEKTALNKFKKWVSTYKTSDPLLWGGQNIRGFDIPILIKRFEEQKISGCPVAFRGEPISPQRIWDLYDITHKWFLFSKDAPYKGYGMESLREFFAVSSKNAHNALQDVYDEGSLLLRFLKLYEGVSPKIKWR